MDIWNYLSFAWIPCLIVAAILQMKAIYLKKLMINKYGFRFPTKYLGIVGIAELKVNRRMTESENLKKIITSFIDSKKWVYRLLVIAVIIVAGPYLIKLWLSDPKKI
jgi:hypothetical protein